MAKQLKDLSKEPLISYGQLARVLDVGTGATKSAADRAGVVATKLKNRRELLSPEEAAAIQCELNKTV